MFSLVFLSHARKQIITEETKEPDLSNDLHHDKSKVMGTWVECKLVIALAKVHVP